MPKLVIDITTSLDGFVAGPNQSLDDPLGEGATHLHDWALSLEAWRKPHGHGGGETNASSAVMEEHLESIGASVMGRRMYSGGEGSWEDDPNANGWWGDEPPFHHPVFVLTHHAREPLAMEGTTFTFVTDGIESALEQATAAAGGKAVHVAGGAQACQQYLAAGLVDEVQLHVVPLLLGDGERLLDNLGGADLKLEQTRVVEAPGVTHVRYRVVK